MFPLYPARDGATRCGLLCAATYLIEHMKTEQEVDVFHAVHHVRSSRPQLVTDVVRIYCIQYFAKHGSL